MDVLVLAMVLVGLAAFVAAPLYSTRAAPDIGPQASSGADAVAAALEDLEVDRASGLYDGAEYSDELRTLRQRLPDGAD